MTDKNEDILLVAHAVHFAARHHIDQRRKGERAEPYMNHLSEVASLLAEATGGASPALVAAGYLHDVVEDCEVTPAELRAEFGGAITDLVAEVTDDNSLNKTERKRREVDKAPHLSIPAKMLKLADKTSNLRSIRHSPPSGWSRERMQEYVTWANDIVAGCRGTNAKLEAAFDDAKKALDAHLRAH